PHVLDRDQRLVGESGDELDLPVRERLDVIALETDDGDHYAVAQQRNPEHGALPADLLGLQHVVLGISQAIRQVNRFSLNRGSADQRAASRCYRMLKEVFDIVGPPTLLDPTKWYLPSCNLKKRACSASHRRPAVCRMASITACSSLGEREMT